MSKLLSTYERKTKDPKFKKAYKKSYKELLFSELIISIMENDKFSVRKLAKETNLSPSVVQSLRAGTQHDLRLSNLIKIARAFGYEIILQKGKKRLRFKEGTENSKQLSVVEAG